MGTQTVHPERMQYGGPGQLWAAPLATLTSAYAPAGTGGAFTQGTTATSVPGNAAWVPLGDFGSPTQFDYTFNTEEITVENSYDPVATVATGRRISVKAELVDWTLWQYQLALSAATTAWSGTPTATTTAKFTPPAPGQEGRYQLLWQSQDNTDVMVVYQTIQVGNISERRGKGAAGRASLAVEFKGELPAASVATSLFNRWRIGANAAATLSTDI